MNKKIVFLSAMLILFLYTAVSAFSQPVYNNKVEQYNLNLCEKNIKQNADIINNQNNDIHKNQTPYKYNNYFRLF